MRSTPSSSQRASVTTPAPALRVPVSRRRLLEGLGVGAGLVPLLGRGPARAAERPRRLVVIGVPNGYTSDYVPLADGATWKAKDVEFSPLKSLEPYRDKVLVLGGINIQNGIDTARALKNTGIGGHAILPFLLTGAKGVPGPAIPDGWSLSSGGPSVDQYVVQNMPGAKQRPFESLVLRPVKLSSGGYGNQPMSYSGKCLDGRTHNAPTIRDNPFKLFDELFGTGVDTSTFDKTRAQRRSILDFNAAQLRQLQARVGKDDKIRVQNHLDGLAAVEKRLQSAGAAAACKGAMKPTDASLWVDAQSNPKMNLVMRSQIEMTVAALACDLTRVASFSWCQSNNNTITFPWLAEKIPSLNERWTGTETAGSGNNLRNHHTIAHNEGALRREKNLTDGFFIENFAYLVKLLSETRDFDGKPLLDNTLVLYTNMQRTGGGHQTDNLIWFLAGNCDGAFKSGRFLPNASGKAGQMAPTNGIFTAVVNALGCPPVTSFGDPAYGGELLTLRG
jgi:hypothetical protein